MLFFAWFLGFLPASILRGGWGYASLLPGGAGVLIRFGLLKNLAAQCGENVYIARFVVIKNWEALSIGDNVSIHEGCYIDAYGGVTIGSNVSIAHQVSIVSFDHGWSDLSCPIKYNPSTRGAILIADDVWIGCGSRLLASSCISQRSVVAAGAVVRGVFSCNVVLAGVPAKIIKNI